MAAGASVNRGQRVGRFLTRLWLVVAALWWGTVGITYWAWLPDYHLPHDLLLRDLAQLSLAALLPLGVYALGAALFWAFRVLWE